MRDFSRTIAPRAGGAAIDVSAEARQRYGEKHDDPRHTRRSWRCIPKDTAEVVAVVAVANRHRVPLYPISAGNNIGLGSRAPVRDGQGRARPGLAHVQDHRRRRRTGITPSSNRVSRSAITRRIGPARRQAYDLGDVRTTNGQCVGKCH